MKHLFVFLLIWLCSNRAYSQCNINNFSFQSGETVTYHAYYNWHFLWLNAGIVHFKVENKTYDDKDSWFFSAYGRTYSGYDHFMKVRDTFEVYVDKQDFNPLFFNRVTKEGSTESHHKYYFNHNTNQIQTQIKRGEESSFKDSTLQLQDCTNDLLTMVYKARNLNFSQYESGDKIPIRMIVDGKIHDLYIRYLGKETVKNRDGRRFRCLKFSPLLVPGTIFESGEDMTVWVTDDQCRIPIVVEAKVLIGSVKAVFVDVAGLRNEMSAEVFE
ncbi:DUF3108 domain-containing protein [Plebeiibacterium marinum]|uniref:DUF3108 domain-containing protein n=1 Tax=Plebeiibacterium marinum TaxID=2992111 RepID=A0AAE3SHX3_9BACT|nr:DUF3108 domain-containing protein [Plebeiobacterium marinum]MCW3804037.1 DUF3108 domain-containing protein [Plebeiobacterium marinum]